MFQNRYKQPFFYPFVDFFLAFESRLRRNDYILIGEFVYSLIINEVLFLWYKTGTRMRKIEQNQK